VFYCGQNSVLRLVINGFELHQGSDCELRFGDYRRPPNPEKSNRIWEGQSHGGRLAEALGKIAEQVQRAARSKQRQGQQQAPAKPVEQEGSQVAGMIPRRWGSALKANRVETSSRVCGMENIK
jgi:hypothetical protein